MAKDYFAYLKARPLYTPTEQVSQQEASQQGRIGDLVDAGQAGLFSALGGMFDFVGAESLASSMYKNSDEQYTQMSERGREALSKSFVEEDDQGNVTLGDGATDLDTWLLTMANVAGQFAGTAVPGAGWASGAAKLASLGAKGKNIANIASMGATGGAAATGQGMEQARQEVQNMPDTLLADSPLFGDVLRGVHANQPELSNVEKWEAAKTALANKVAQEVRTDPKVLLANFGASAIGDPIIGKALTGARLAKSGALRSALAGFVTEGSTEAVQAGVQQLGANKALQPIDNRDEMQGVVAAGLNEGLAGGGFGAAAGGIGGLVNRQPKQQTPQTEPTAEPAPQPSADPVTEQMKASNPNLGEAMASMDQHSTNVKNEVDNLDIPTAARQAGFDTNAGAGQFGDFITSPSQESIQSMRNQSIADMVNDAINNIGPTPDDRFSPIKYQHVGELLSPEQSTDLQPAPRKNAQIDSGFIDGEMVPEQGLLPTQQQTQNRQAFERVQSEFNNQPAQIESKDIIFGEDGRPRQRAAERVKQAGKNAQNLLPQKDIIFAGNESGVNVARNGKPFKSMKEARNSKLARQAKRQGLTVDVVPFDNGYGWKVNEPATLTDEGAIPQSTERNIESNAQPTANLAGDPINGEWTAFNEQSETKNIPRAEMPQIKAENRGAMVNFMNARDISHEQDEVPASSLKPTQQEFSPAKVKKAMEFEGGNRSILVSSDNYVLDGHHQWLAAREKGEPVKVIRLNAPIEQLVPLAKEMPSTETQDNAGNLTSTGNEETTTTGKLNSDSGKQSEQKAVKTAETGKLIEQEPAANEQANQLPSILKTTKRKWLQSEAKKLGLKKGSPGYDAAIAKIEESYEPAIDKALAESSFETYQEFNSDTPESINRQAYSELRKEFGLDDQPIEKPQEQKTVQANDTESPNSSENKKVDDPVAAEPEANEQQSTTNQATAKQESINDFGEKLGGARKDAWSGFSEAILEQQNTAELPLSKSWPEPNYKELAEKGVSAESIALMAAMRSEIPSKPRVARKVARWAEKVNALKSLASYLVSGELDSKSVMQRMRDQETNLSSTINLPAIANAVPAIAKADIDTLKNVSDYRINSGSFSVFGGKKYTPSKIFYFIERKSKPTYEGASENLSDVQALLAKQVQAEQSKAGEGNGAKQSKISVYIDRYTKQSYLGWKGASGVLKIKEFKSTTDARNYLNENRAEVEKTLQKMKDTPKMRKPVNDERIGPERYAGEVTPEIFAGEFGFRGVEFGNWVEQNKRQKDLNQAYDGLMDLAEALDIQPKALSLNGQLGLAFGARGKGGKEPAAAHYEPNTVVINLTKKAGAGSLAHEWWHALDNYFGKQKSRGEFITDMPYSMPTDQIRPEMADAFKHVRNAVIQSGLPERSRELDTRRSKAYWATNIEMTARSFETYIIDKLSQQGITNDYLANVVGDEAWSAAEALGFEGDNTYPYPNKSEQEQINPAYQSLFDAMESENTNEGIRLFSKSKANKKSQGVKADKAQEIANNFIKGLNGANGITVNILEDTASAEKLWRMSLDGATVKGAYSEMSNTVYVIAENIDSETDLKQTLAHETIAHGGLDTVIGKEAKQAFIDRIKKTKGRKAFEQYWKDANNDYWDMSDDVKAEEIFARFVENEPSKGELKYWWNALKRWIKAQLDKAGIMYREDDELTAMREMLESIVKGFKAQREPMVNNQAEMAYSQSDKKFSRTADNDTRTAKEKLGLEEQARETIADRAKEKVNETVDTLKSSSFWQRLNEGIFDGLAGIKQAEVSAGVTDPNKQGYVSARLASGLADVLHGVFNYGAPVWKDGIIQRKENTKGLLEVFGMVGDDLNNWLAWMGANRAEKLKEQGRENNLTQADIDELKALANGKEELFEQVRQEYNKVNSAILDVAQGAGLLSEEQRASFDEEYYVPFFRDMGETDAEMDDIKRMIVEPHMRKGIASQSAKIKELKGGKQSTKDLLENIIARQSTLIDASLKNKAMQEVVNNLDGTDYMTHEKSEEAKNRTQEQLNNDGKVRVMVNGKPQAYLVSDPALLRALIQINDVGSQSLFNKMSRSAKRFLTAGITLSPDFIFKNFVRDAAHAWMINKDDFKFGTDSIKGLKKAFKEDEAYRDLIFSGAAFQGGYIHGADPEAAAQQTRRALRSKGLTTNEIDGYLDTVVNSGAELLEKYRGISDKVENANRLSTYEAALAAGKSKRQAAYESKDVMDYSLKGNFKLIGTMIDMLPFFNARLQGMSKLVRAAKAGDGDRVLKVLSANLAMKGIKVAGFSLALAAMNDDDERYQELPDWDKDMNWHFFAGDQHFRIPKPFELGIIFGTLPERMLHTATGTQTGGDLGKAVANAVINTLALNPIPQFALPATEVLVNKSFFKDAPIEGMADENKQAEDRYNTYTSEVAKGIGSTFGVSPKKVEHLIKGYTGTIGGYVLGASDIVARQIMGKETADTPVSRYPVIKAFYQGSGPKGSTKFANDFYESLEAANQAYGSYKRAMEEGDTSRQQELIEGAGDKLRSRIALGRVQRAASKLGKMARAVNDNPNLTGEQKRKQLDDIQRQKNALYHQAYVTINLGEW
jgi:hypothetical protein